MLTYDYELRVSTLAASSLDSAGRRRDHGREKFEYQFHSHVWPASALNARL
jgi:hypothetical protein